MIPPIDHPQSAEEYAVFCDAKESFAWTRGCLVGGGQYEWVKALPVEQRVVLPDGTRVLLVHASPGHDDGWGLHPDWSTDALEEAGFTGDVADLILVGHTHVAGDRRIADTHAVNPGSVSLPRIPDDRARWALLEAIRDGYTVEYRDVQYDLGQVIADLDRQAHPSSAWLAVKMTGRHAMPPPARHRRVLPPVEDQAGELSPPISSCYRGVSTQNSLSSGSASTSPSTSPCPMSMRLAPRDTSRSTSA